MQSSVEILRRYFGHAEFREGQQQLIEHMLSSRDVLGVMPTGSGKSMCYQIPALMLPGVALVVSPLISLMKDQVDALTQQGIKAAFLNSSLSPVQYEKALENARAGAYKIIYVAPERLENPGFLDFAQATDISMVAVDEAHCVSKWGQDFRPSYLGISEFLKKLSIRPVLGAFTATATDRVREDIARLLQLREPYCLVTGFDRANLYFSVKPSRDKLGLLLDFLSGKRDKSGIIYCSTRKQVEQVCNNLSSNGYSATRYHAGLDENERHKNQEDFIYDRKRIIVATNAFGMGIDKSDVRFVVHFNMPGNLENYYQEAGRAGRDGEYADCLLLYQPKDVGIQKYFIDNDTAPSDEFSEEQRADIRANNYELLRKMTYYCQISSCLRAYILGYFGEDAQPACGNCANCNAQFEKKDITVETQKIVSCVIRIERRGYSFGKRIVADVLHGSKSKRMSELKLDRLPTYGVMADKPMREIQALIDHLVMKGYLAVNDEKFGVLQSTVLSKKAISRDAAITMMAQRQEQPKSFRGTRSMADYRDIDAALFEKLRSLRTDIASKSDLPAYIVFSDATLKDMCSKLPQTEAQFMQVSGVGEQKCERYWQPFTAVISRHLQQDG